MFLTGFADEASPSLAGQIHATKLLGWTGIESRNFDGKQLYDLSPAEIDQVKAELDNASMHIDCLGSAISNWQKQITDPFETTLDEVTRAIAVCQKFAIPRVRMMSFAVLKDDKGRLLDDQMPEERFRRLREIVQRFNDAGVECVHENCMNYGGMGAEYTLRLIYAVPNLNLVFDTGNPVFTPQYPAPDSKNLSALELERLPRQNAWEFYQTVKARITYVHIKDGKLAADGSTEYTYPGEGNGFVKEIVADLLKNGYQGGFSMEPHLKVVYHDPSVAADPDAKISTYVEYGRRFMKLLDNIK